MCEHTNEKHHDHEHCSCGHEHHHEHHSCSCGHEHHHEHTHEHHHDHPTIFILENLGCANCAAKMEEKINQLPNVTASITFATKKLRITAQYPEKLLPKLQDICSSIEPDVRVILQKEHEHHHEEEPVNRTALISIIIGALFFATAILFENTAALPLISTSLFVISYFILGGRILLTAGKNLLKGHIFDENFLMSIATLGAFAISEYPEAVGIMLFYRIGELFEESAVQRSRKQIMTAIDMRPETVNLVSDHGHTHVISASDVQIGQILLIRPGDRIPLDGIVVEGESRLDTSPITGEPVPVSVYPGKQIISGCVNTTGQLKMRVEKPLSESMVSRILSSVENAAANKPKIDRFITKFAKIYTPFVVATALIIAIIPSFITKEWHYWLYTAISFLVMSCPCALVLSVPLAFFSGIGAGSQEGILFKGGASMEALSNVKVAVVDKTGTITEGNFALQQIVPANGFSAEEVLIYASACEQHSTHPIAASILSAAKEKHLELLKVTSMEEVPGHGILAVINEKEVLCGNKKLMERHNISLENVHIPSGSVEVYMAVDHIYAGHFVISDTLKSDAKTAIAALKKQGLFTVMLTGDAQENALTAGNAAGIDEVHGKLLPEDKLSILQNLQKTKGPALFVGDGINDAPVLAGADVGGAMGSGTDAAIEAADLVFMKSNVSAIPRSIIIARQAKSIAWQNVIFALIIKALVMILGLIGYANMWMAVFADTGVAMICVINSIRLLYKKN